MSDTSKEKQIIKEVQKILRQRANELSKEKSRSLEKKAHLESYFVFNLGTDSFAIHMNDIEEIHDITEITPIPCTPDFLLGMTNLRGRIISVLDLKSYIKTKSNVIYERDKASFFVVKTDQFICSFIVSEILEKIEINVDDINSIGSEKKKDNYVSQSFKLGRKSVGILNIKKLLNQPEFIIDN